ncbi:hypothetical protein [Pseudomonas phage pPA-3099-2aT.2]|uniref:Uncharacterized protein n=1 Tax=Pseudomonas phage pPA-3099-2aT.2 TaxID=3003808 RepID=A0AAE9W534_9CAUD|nr:hypothetical protein QE325_gp108 [Pseudomonas phage pPA-3099-2aT.2]WBQ35273.1 hypothetical protein [Pseudomonas phage pPA-3099-2aT.2]
MPPTELGWVRHFRIVTEYTVSDPVPFVDFHYWEAHCQLPVQCDGHPEALPISLAKRLIVKWNAQCVKNRVDYRYELV